MDEKKTSLTVEQAFTLYQHAQREKIAAIVAASDALKTLAEAAGSKTFSYQGQVYQVRVRPNKELGAEMGYPDPAGYPLAFLCLWKRSPKETFAEARDRTIVQLTSNENGSATNVTTEDSQEDSPEQQHQAIAQQVQAQEQAHQAAQALQPRPLTGGSIQASDLLGGTVTDDGAIVLE